MDKIECNGRMYSVKIVDDYYADAPWVDCDGHGPVRQSKYRHSEGQSDKRPGERPMNSAGRNEYQFYYDWQTACKLADKDGWNAQPFDAPGRVLRAVQANFDYLSGYVNQEWQYVGVIVTLLDDDGDETSESESLWSIETFKDYHLTVAPELAQEIDDRMMRKMESDRLEDAISNRFHDAMACGV